MTISEKYRKELTEKIGRLATPAILIGDQVFLGFGANQDQIMALLQKQSEK